MRVALHRTGVPVSESSGSSLGAGLTRLPMGLRRVCVNRDAFGGDHETEPCVRRGEQRARAPGHLRVARRRVGIATLPERSHLKLYFKCAGLHHVRERTSDSSLLLGGCGRAEKSSVASSNPPVWHSYCSAWSPASRSVSWFVSLMQTCETTAYASFTFPFRSRSV